MLHISVGCFLRKQWKIHIGHLSGCNGLLHIFGQTLFCSVSGSPSPSAPLSQRRSESSLSKGSDALGLFPFPSSTLFLMLHAMASRDSANSRSRRILDCFPKLSRRCRSRLRCGEVSESGSELLPSRFLTERNGREVC